MTILLVFMTLADVIAALVGFFVPSFGFSLAGALALAKLVCAIGIWNWRKWGVMGTLVIAVAHAVTSFFGVFGIVRAIATLVIPGLLVIFIRPVWRYFK